MSKWDRRISVIPLEVKGTTTNGKQVDLVVFSFEVKKINSSYKFGYALAAPDVGWTDSYHSYTIKKLLKRAKWFANGIRLVDSAANAASPHRPPGPDSPSVTPMQNPSRDYLHIDLSLRPQAWPWLA